MKAQENSGRGAGKSGELASMGEIFDHLYYIFCLFPSLAVHREIRRDAEAIAVDL